MENRRLLVPSALLVLALAQTSSAQTMISLTNGDIENNTTGQFGSIAGWGPNGGWAAHSGFARPGNETLGANFGFYSAGLTETVSQLSTHTMLPNTTYRFWSFAQGGGDDTGTIPYVIGYATWAGDISTFVPLATQTAVVGNAWVEQAGVTYTTGDSGAEIGNQIIFRLGSGADGGASDVWFDNLQASYDPVPEPATMVTLGLGALALLRKRRKV